MPNQRRHSLASRHNTILSTLPFFADEERFELSTIGLTSHRSAIELFILLLARWSRPGGRTHSLGLKVRCIYRWATNQLVMTERLELSTGTVSGYCSANWAKSSFCCGYKSWTCICRLMRPVCYHYTKPPFRWPKQTRRAKLERVRFLLSPLSYRPL